MKRFPGIAVLLLVCVAFLAGGEVVDRIAAIVNDDIILLSEVDEKMFILQASGQLEGREESEIRQVRREILDRLIEEKLVVQRAMSQGIEADNQEVTGRVDEAMEKVRSRFPSLEAFRQALQEEGISENMLRERYQSDITQEMLGQRIVGREVRSKVQVTTDDVQRYYEEHADELPRKPNEIHLAHWLASPVTPEQEAAAREEIQKARNEIVDGESFEAAAEKYSDDPSRGQGGLLGWFQPGDLDPDFEAAVDTLKVGELSKIVRTRHGYHLIEVMEREGARYRVRHILVMMQYSESDKEAARKRAEEARQKLDRGESFEDLIPSTEDFLTRDRGGDLGWTPMEFLLPQVKEELDSLTVGEVSPVIETDRGFHIFKVLNRRHGEEYEYDEIKDQLMGYLQQQELQKAYDDWLQGIRDSAYVEIKTWER